jgi:multidrug transporter EmrE-like cation transporter
MLKKKMIALSLATSLLASNLLMAKRSEAIIGLATANPIIVISGYAAYAVGGVMTTVSGFYETRETRHKVALRGILLMAAGIVLLDDGDQPILRFAPIADSKDAQKLTMTPVEHEAFNDEVEELNASLEMSQADANAAVAKGEELTPEKMHALVSKNLETVSPEARSAASKVAAAFAETNQL